MKLFQPEDFYNYRTPIDCAEIANAKFEKWLSEQPVVFSEEWITGEPCQTRTVWCQDNADGTRKARLVCLEEIEE